MSTYTANTFIVAHRRISHVRQCPHDVLAGRLGTFGRIRHWSADSDRGIFNDRPALERKVSRRLRSWCKHNTCNGKGILNCPRRLFRRRKNSRRRPVEQERAEPTMSVGDSRRQNQPKAFFLALRMVKRGLPWDDVVLVQRHVQDVRSLCFGAAEVTARFLFFLGSAKQEQRSGRAIVFRHTVGQNGSL